MPEQLDEVHLGTRWNYHREELAKLSTTFHMKYRHLCIISGKGNLDFFSIMTSFAFFSPQIRAQRWDKNSHEKRRYFSSRTHTKARGSLSPVMLTEGKIYSVCSQFFFFATFVKRQTENSLQPIFSSCPKKVFFFSSRRFTLIFTNIHHKAYWIHPVFLTNLCNLVACLRLCAAVWITNTRASSPSSILNRRYRACAM